MNGNEIIYIPEDIGELKSLKKLELIDNDLNWIPPILFTLSNLKSLKLSDNRFNSVPLEFAELPRECELFLSFKSIDDFKLLKNRIGNVSKMNPSKGPQLKFSDGVERLDSWCEKARGTHEFHSRLETARRILNAANYGVDYIEELDLSGLELTSLPEGISEIPNIFDINLSNNKLKNLPADFGELDLNTLDLSNNEFSSVPNVVFEIENIENLFLTGNPLTSLPLEAAEIETLEFDASDLITNLREFEEAYYENHPDEERKTYTISDTLKFWLDKIERAFPAFSNRNRYPSSESYEEFYQPLLEHSQHELLMKYLNRLIKTQDYNSPVQSNLLLRVDRMLEGACRNSEFQEKVFMIMGYALTSCSDRVTESFDDIEIQWRILCNAQKMDDKEFVELVIGINRKNELDKIAIRIFPQKKDEYNQKVRDLNQQGQRERARNLPMPDQLETVLAYRIGLKNELKLPTSTEHMLYAQNSYVTKKDLIEAKSKILQEENPLEILLQSDLWKDRIRTKYLDEFEKINNEIMNLEGSQDDQQIKTSEIIYAKMKELTMKELAKLK